MKIAIPLFETRVSPRFGYAQTMLVVEVANNTVKSRDVVKIGMATHHERIKKIVELGIDTLICGGINRFTVEQLNFLGIKVYTCVTGEADDALDCFRRGELESGAMIGPGGRCRGRWRFHNGICLRTNKMQETKY